MLTINKQEFLKLSDIEKARILKKIASGNIKYIDTNKELIDINDNHILEI